MTRYVALLRAVNVAGHGLIGMEALRETFRSLGYTDVATYIQSGNVVFSAKAAVEVGGLERAIAHDTRMDVTLMLRTAAQMGQVVERNPFPDPSKVHVGFMAQRPTAAAVRALDVRTLSPDEASVEATEVYLHLPNGVGRSKLPAALARQLGVPITLRNWNTVTKLAELAHA